MINNGLLDEVLHPSFYYLGKRFGFHLLYKIINSY